MSEHTETPWVQIDHGVGELVVYCPETDKAICTFGDTDNFWAWPEHYFSSGVAEANAKHIVHCVNNHQRLVQALRDCVSGECDLNDIHNARALLAELDAGEGGEV